MRITGAEVIWRRLKTLVLYAVIFAWFLPPAAHAGWKSQPPPYTSIRLYAVWGSGPDDVFAVGTYSGVDTYSSEDPGLCTILHYNGTTWTTMSSCPAGGFLDVWGSGPNDVFIVGGSGTILHYNGTDWTTMSSGTTYTLYGVWGSGPDDIFAVGTGGNTSIILHYDGTEWTSVFSSDPYIVLQDIWGSGPNDVFVVGTNGTIFHYDGTEWMDMSQTTIEWFSGIWGSGLNDVFMVGTTTLQKGNVHYFDGTGWTTIVSNTAYSLNHVWGSGPNDVFVVGYHGTILHYDGTNWKTMSSGTTVSFYGVWGSGPDNVFAVGEDGTILHYSPESGNGDGGGNDCFLATAAWGSYLDPHVKVLRDFRDRYLLTNRLGRAFVSFYYKHSPPIASYIRQHESLRTALRFMLTPIVYGVEYPWLILIFGGILVVIWIPAFAGMTRINRIRLFPKFLKRKT